VFGVGEYKSRPLPGFCPSHHRLPPADFFGADRKKVRMTRTELRQYHLERSAAKRRAKIFRTATSAHVISCNKLEKLTFSKRRISATLGLALHQRLRRAWNVHGDYRILPQPGFEAPNPSLQPRSLPVYREPVRDWGSAAQAWGTRLPRASAPGLGSGARKGATIVLGAERHAVLHFARSARND